MLHDPSHNEVGTLSLAYPALSDNGGGSWSKKRRLTINDFQTDYETKITIDFDSEMQAGFADIRFYDEVAKQELPYWIESKTDGVSATVWLKTGSNNSISIFYSNPSATFAADPQAPGAKANTGFNTFWLFDDFNDNILNVDKWVNYGGTSETNSEISVGGKGYKGIRTKETIKDFVFDGRFKKVNFDDGMTMAYFGWDGICAYPGLNCAFGFNATRNLVTKSLPAGSTFNLYADIYYPFKMTSYNDLHEIYVAGSQQYNRLYSGTDSTYSAGGFLGVGTKENNALWYPTNSFAKFDDVRIRKYVLPEPTVSVEASESSSGENAIIEGALDPNTTYTRHIHARNDGGQSSASASAQKYTLPSAPDIFADKTTSIWYNSPDIVFNTIEPFGTGGIEYYKYLFDHLPGPVFDGSEQTWNSSTITKTISSSSWFLHAKSFNVDDEEGGVQTLGPFYFEDIKPTQPLNLSAASTSTAQIDIDWDASTDAGGSGLVGYKIERSPSILGVPIVFVEVGTSVDTTYSDTDVLPNVGYIYRIRAYDGAGNNGVYSSEVSRVTVTDPPTNPIATNGTLLDQIKLSWTSSLNADHYHVYKDGDKDSGVLIYDSNGSSLIDPVSDDDIHEYFIYASNSEDAENLADINASGYRQAVLNAPTINEAAAISDDSIQWNFSDNAGNEDGFKLHDDLHIEVGTAGANATSITESGLLPNVSYSRHVHAYNGGGDSAASANASKTTLSEPPTLPIASDGAFKGKIQVSWVASPSADHYHVYKDGDKDTGTLIFDVNSTDFIDTVNDDLMHTYYIYAANSQNKNSVTFVSDSGYQDSVPAAPTAESAQNLSTSSIKWTFSDNSTNEEGFALHDALHNEIQSVLGQASDFTETLLAANISYTRHVHAFNNAGESAASADLNDTTYADPPTVPPILPVATDGTIVDQIDVNWVASPNASSYRVYKTVADIPGTSSTGLDGDVTISGNVNIKDLYEDDDVVGATTDRGVNKGLNKGSGTYNPSNGAVPDFAFMTVDGILTTDGPSSANPGKKLEFRVAQNLTISNGGLIHADGKGYGGGGTYTIGYGTGGGGKAVNWSDATGTGGGGGYGGKGGNGEGAGGITYEPYPALPTFGSGGGGGNTSAGGAGGGLIKISAGNIIMIGNGAIRANGANGSNSGFWSRGKGGGGSGGGIHINSDNSFTNAGNVSANGGAGGVNGANGGGGGGGGGGRIIIETPEAITGSPTVSYGSCVHGGACNGEDGEAIVTLFTPALTPPTASGLGSVIYEGVDTYYIDSILDDETYVYTIFSLNSEGDESQSYITDDGYRKIGTPDAVTIGAAQAVSDASINWNFSSVAGRSLDFDLHDAAHITKATTSGEGSAPALSNGGGGSWSNRKDLIIDDFQPDYQIKMTIIYDPDMQPDFADLRFYDSTSQTELPYSLESKIDSVRATVWFRSGANNDIGLYYGNASATSSSDGEATFEFYEDYEDGDYTSDPAGSFYGNVNGTATIESPGFDGSGYMLSITAGNPSAGVDYSSLSLAPGDYKFSFDRWGCYVDGGATCDVYDNILFFELLDGNTSLFDYSETGGDENFWQIDSGTFSVAPGSNASNLRITGEKEGWEGKWSVDNVRISKDVETEPKASLRFEKDLATSIVEIGLSPNTNYTRHIHAVNGPNESTASADASKTTLSTPPTNAIATDGTIASAVDISWTASASADHYHVYKDGDSLSGSLIYDGPSTMHSDTLVVDEEIGQSHTYYIYSANSENENSSTYISNIGSRMEASSSVIKIYGNSDDDLYLPSPYTTKYMTVDYLRGGGQRSYIRFPLSALQNIGVLSAKLYLKEHPDLTSHTNNASRGYHMYPFDPNAAGTTIAGTPDIDPGNYINLSESANVYSAVDITSHLQEDLGAGRDYSHWRLGGYSGFDFYYASNDYPLEDSDPYLEITIGLGPPLVSSVVTDGDGKLKVNFADQSIGEDDFHFYASKTVGAGPSDFVGKLATTSKNSVGTQYEYIISGLDPDAHYFVRARSHMHSDGNYSPYSDEFDLYTSPNVPLTPLVSVTGDDRLKVVLDSADANPSFVRYAVYNSTLGKYLDVDGTLRDSAAYASAADWTTLGIENTGLEPDSAYSYKAMTISEDNQSFSAFGSASAPLRTLASKPVGAAAVGADDGSGYKVKVSYNSGGAQTNYRIYSSSDNYASVKYEGPATEFEEIGLDINTTYDYRIYALNGDNVVNSNFATASSEVSALPLMAPGIISLTADSDTQLSTFFMDNSTTEDDFHFYIDTYSPALTDDRLPQITLSKPTIGGTDTKVLSDLAPNTRYFVRSRAHDHTTDASSVYSKELAAYTLARTPAQPDVEAVGSDKLEVTIKANGNPAYTKYAIYNDDASGYLQSDGSTGPTPFYQSESQWENNGGAVHKGLNANSGYTYKVKAKNGDGIETAFGPDSVRRHTWTNRPALGIFYSLLIGVDLFISGGGTDDQYEVYETNMGNTVLISQGASTYINRRPAFVDFDDPFIYKAYGVNKDGVKNPKPGYTTLKVDIWLFWGCFFVPDSCSAPMTNLSAEALNDNQIDLNWEVPTENLSSAYYLFRNGENIASLSPSTSNYSDSGLAANTHYSYYVANDTTSSISSNHAGATTFDTGTSSPRTVDIYASDVQTLDYNASTGAYNNWPNYLKSGIDDRLDNDPYGGSSDYVQNTHYLRSFMNFSIKDLSDSVNSATLYLDYAGTYDDIDATTPLTTPDSIDASLDNIKDFGAFDPDDFNISPYYNNIEPLNWLDETTPVQTFVLDVTAQVKADVAAGRDFSSYRIKTTPEATGLDTIFSFSTAGTLRPRLVVNYDLTSNKPAVSNFQSGSATGFSIDVEDKSVDEDEFHFFLATSNQPTIDDGAALISTTKATTGSSYSKSVTGLSPNTKYFIRSKSHSHSPDVYSGYSNELSGYTQAFAPAVLSTQALDANNIKIVIDNAGNSVSTEYAILNTTLSQFLQADGSLGTNAVFKTYDYWGGVFGVINSGLQPSTQYSYQVKARNGDAIETAFSAASANTSTLSGVEAAPTKPKMLVSTDVTSESITWNWQDNAYNEDGYVIHDDTDQLIATVGPGVASYTELGLVKDTQYIRHTHAFSITAGESVASGPEITRTLLGGPINLKTVNKVWPDTTIEVSWDKPPSWTPGYYKVYRYSKRITQDNKDLATVVATPSATNYTDDFGDRGVIYYQVTAMHSDGRESDLAITEYDQGDEAQVGSPLPRTGHKALTDACAVCHRGHTATAKALMIDKGEKTCFACHDGSGSLYDIALLWNSKNSHNEKTKAPATTENRCTLCHDPHGNGPSALKDELPDLCFNCHNSNKNSLHGWDIQGQFSKKSTHNVIDKTADGYLLCTNCHGPHTVQAEQGLTNSNPDNTNSIWTTSKTDFCLKCHDGDPPALSWDTDSLTPNAVVFPDMTPYKFFPGWDKSPFKEGGHNSQGIKCTRCHTPHGSQNDRLKAFNFDDSTEYAEEGLCLKCHGAGGSNSTLYAQSAQGQWGSVERWGLPVDTTQLLTTGNYGSGSNWQSLFKFDIKDLSNVMIKSASLRVYLEESSIEGNYGSQLDLKEVADYGNLDTGDYGSLYKADFGQIASWNSTPGYITIDITNRLKQALEGEYDFMAFKTNGGWGKTYKLGIPTGANEATEPQIEVIAVGSERFNFNAALSSANKHPIATVSDKHKDTEGAAGLGGNNRHAECYDCHNPHESSPNPPKSASLAPKAYGSLKGTLGVAPVNGKPGDALAFIEKPVDNEYELCFRCHSSYVDLPPDKPTTALGGGIYSELGTETQDKAMLFNTNNPSFHPVEGTGKNMGIKDETFVEGTPWNPTAGDDPNYNDASAKVYCSDCHGPDSTSLPEGPHGSTNASILKGHFKQYYETRWGGFICFQCHKQDVYGTGNGIAGGSRYEHPTMGSSSINCRYCHTVHGSTESEHLLDIPYKHIEPGEDPSMPNGGGIFLAYKSDTLCNTCHRNNGAFPKKYKAAYP